jgi:hypothetical protein
MSSLGSTVLGTFVQSPRPPNETTTHQHRWHVLRTRSRHEKILAAQLTAAGLTCFVPLVRTMRVYANTPAIVAAPLFPGHAFLHGSQYDVHEAERTMRVISVVAVADPRQVGLDLHHLHRAVSVDARLEPCTVADASRPVRVAEGPMAGLEGFIADARPAELVLRVHGLAQAACLRLNGERLERLDN